MSNNKELLSYLNKLNDDTNTNVPKYIESDTIDSHKIPTEVKVDIEIDNSTDADINKEIEKIKHEENKKFQIKTNFIKENIVKSIQNHFNLKPIKIFDDTENSYLDDSLYHILIAWDDRDIKYEYDYLKKFVFIRFIHSSQFVSINKAVVYIIKTNEFIEYTFNFEKDLYKQFRRRLGIK